LNIYSHLYRKRGRRGRDRMVVGFTTTYAISAYHHWREFESRSGRDVQHYVIKFVSNLRQVGGFLLVRVESGVKHHQTNKHKYIVTYVHIQRCKQRLRLKGN